MKYRKGRTFFACSLIYSIFLKIYFRSHLIEKHPNEDLPTAFAKLDEETTLNTDNLKQETLDDSDKLLERMEDSNNSSELYPVKQEKEKKLKK